jgi:hypothetical protein
MKPIDDKGRSMPAGAPLFSQPGSFWIGAFMVAEGPVLLAVSFLEPATREHLGDVVLGSPLAMLGVVVVAGMAGLLVGWLGHRLGFGP